MINGKASEFIDKLYYADNYVLFHGEKYFANGCQSRKSTDGKIISVRLEVYNLTSDTTVFSVTKPSSIECVRSFEEAAIWDGKKFWEAECQMQWVDKKEFHLR